MVAALFEKIDWEKADCIRCTTHPLLPDCNGLKLVMHKGTDCDDQTVQRKTSLDSQTCEQIDTRGANGLKKDFSWSFALPSPTGQVHCAQPDPEKIVPDIEHDWHFRACNGKAKGTCAEQNQVCGDFSYGPACVYRPGKFSCPAGYDGKRYQLFGSFSDDRDCSACVPKLKPGRLGCSGEVAMFNNKACTLAGQKDQFTLNALSDRCWTNPEAKANHWTNLKVQDYKAVFSGECTTSGWDPVGRVRMTDPVTLCCQEEIPPS